MKTFLTVIVVLGVVSCTRKSQNPQPAKTQHPQQDQSTPRTADPKQGRSTNLPDWSSFDSDKKPDDKVPPPVVTPDSQVTPQQPPEPQDPVTPVVPNPPLRPDVVKPDNHVQPNPLAQTWDGSKDEFLDPQFQPKK